MDEAGPEAALHAEGAETRLVVGNVVGHASEPRVLAHGHADAAAHAAVRTRRLHRPHDGGRRLLGAERARGTGGHALAAGRADRLGHRAVAHHSDLHGVATAEHGDGTDLLDVVAGGGAAPAEDAGFAIEHEERFRAVDVESMERRPRRSGQAVPLRGRTELTESVPAVARRQHRVGELEHARAHAHDVGVRRAHHHALAHGEMAGRRGAAHALYVDETGATGAERRPIGVLAELGQRDGEAVHRVQHGRAGGNVDGSIVDHELHGGLS